MANPLRYLSEVREELYKVSYPSSQEVIRLTAIVIAVSLVVAFLLSGLDFVFAKVIEAILQIQ